MDTRLAAVIPIADSRLQVSDSLIDLLASAC